MYAWLSFLFPKKKVIKVLPKTKEEQIQFIMEDIYGKKYNK